MSVIVDLLLLCAAFTIIECHVIKTNRVEIPAEGMTLKIVIKPNDKGTMDLRVRAIDNKDKINNKDHKDLKQEKNAEASPTENKVHAKTATELPRIESRLGIVNGQCADGFVYKSGFCFPDYS